MRTEEDFLGPVEIPQDALYGIHAVRARENFFNHTAFHPEWYQAVGLTKKACYQTYKRFKDTAAQQYRLEDFPLHWMDDAQIDALVQAAAEIENGRYAEFFIVPAVQGGAGTSINMNINEIIANRALQLTGYKPGQYEFIDPVEHANIFQSTNDVLPTALKIAAIRLLTGLEDKINALRSGIEQLETQHRNDLRIGYTQMQEAVPSSFGKLFSNFSDALSRDWWRVSKCFERIKVVNIGGSAIGTGITVPRFFLMEIVPALQRLTGLPVTRGENLTDPTSNQDSIVEVHGILKAHAVNLEKLATDLRLLGADVHGSHEIELPARQAGSSIMPGKVNPVIPEFAISAVHQVYSNDQLIATLAGRGCLELNAYLPQIGHALLDSLKLLIRVNESLQQYMIAGLKVNPKTALNKLYRSPSLATALLPYTGYHQAEKLARKMKAEGLTIFQANEALQLISAEKLQKILKPEQLLKGGFSLKEISS